MGRLLPQQLPRGAPLKEAQTKACMEAKRFMNWHGFYRQEGLTEAAPIEREQRLHFPNRRSGTYSWQRRLCVPEWRFCVKEAAPEKFF